MVMVVYHHHDHLLLSLHTYFPCSPLLKTLIWQRDSPKIDVMHVSSHSDNLTLGQPFRIRPIHVVGIFLGLNSPLPHRAAKQWCTQPSLQYDTIQLRRKYRFEHLAARVIFGVGAGGADRAPCCIYNMSLVGPHQTGDGANVFNSLKQTCMA